MAEDRLKTWETLFKRALVVIDSVAKTGASFEPWSFGGGTVLMRRHRHRFSKDIDIFVPDPQYLGYVNPRLNDTAESLTGDYVEEHASLKLLFSEGEIDFIASAPLTSNPTVVETLFRSRNQRRDIDRDHGAGPVRPCPGGGKGTTGARRDPSRAARSEGGRARTGRRRRRIPSPRVRAAGGSRIPAGLRRVSRDRQRCVSVDMMRVTHAKAKSGSDPDFAAPPRRAAG